MIGIIGKKKEMSQIFKEDGKLVPVTIIEAGPCTIVGKRTEEKEGYNAVILGFGEKKKANKPYSGTFKKINLKPPAIIKEFRDFSKEVQIGEILTTDIFNPGSKVNITGYSKGKGFAGVMKKCGFKGGPKTHGSKFHRRPGSIGSSTTPGRVYKGHGMPGRMGNKKVTVKNLEIVKIEKEKNLLFIKGQVPGPKDGIVVVRSAT